MRGSLPRLSVPSRTIEKGATDMDNTKPGPLIKAPPRILCPICRQSTYSAGGIHPQCAMVQADAPRQKILHAAKKELARQVRVRLEDND